MAEGVGVVVIEEEEEDTVEGSIAVSVVVIEESDDEDEVDVSVGTLLMEVEGDINEGKVLASIGIVGNGDVILCAFEYILSVNGVGKTLIIISLLGDKIVSSLRFSLFLLFVVTAGGLRIVISSVDNLFLGSVFEIMLLLTNELLLVITVGLGTLVELFFGVSLWTLLPLELVRDFLVLLVPVVIVPLESELLLLPSDLCMIGDDVLCSLRGLLCKGPCTFSFFWSRKAFNYRYR